MLVRASAISHPPACDRRPRLPIAHLVGLAILLFGHAADGLQSPPRDAGGGRLEFADCRRLGRGDGSSSGAVGGVVSVRGPAGSVVTRRGASAPAAFVVRGVCAGPVLVCAAPPPHLPECGAGGVCPLPGDPTRYCRCGTRGAFRLRAVYRCPPGTYFVVAEGRCVTGPAVTEPPRPCDEAGPQLEAPPTTRTATPAPTPAPADSAGREASPKAAGAAQTEDADTATAAAARDADGAVYDAGSQNSTSGNSTDRVLAGPVSTNTRNVSRVDSSGGSASGKATIGNHSALSYEVPGGAVPTATLRTAAGSTTPSQTLSSGSNGSVLASAVPTNAGGVAHAIISGDFNSPNSTNKNVAPISGNVPTSIAPNVSTNAGYFHTAAHTASVTQNASSRNQSATEMGHSATSLLSTLAQAVLGPLEKLVASASLYSPSMNATTASAHPVPVSRIPVATNTARVPVKVPSAQIGNAPAYNVQNSKTDEADTNSGPSSVAGPANNIPHPSVPHCNPTATPAPVPEPVPVPDRSRAPSAADAKKTASLSNCTCTRCGKPHVLDSYAENTPIIVADANVDRMPVGMRMLDLFLQENDRRFQEMVCSKTINEESSSSTLEDSKTTVVVLQDEKGHNNTQLKCKGGKVLESSVSMPLQSKAKSSTPVVRGVNVWQFVPLYTLRNEESKQFSNIGLCGVTGVTDTEDGRKEEIKNWEFLSEDSDFEGPHLKLKDIIESIARSENRQLGVKNVASLETITVSNNDTHLSKNIQTEDNSQRNASESPEHSITISRKTRDNDEMKVNSSDFISSSSKSSERDDWINRIKEAIDTLQDNLEPNYFVDNHDGSEHYANYNTNSRKVRRDCSDMLRSIKPQIQRFPRNSKLKENAHPKGVQRLVDELSASIGPLYPEDEKIILKKCINVTALRALFKPKEDEENVTETVHCTSIQHLNETEFPSTPEVPAKSPTKPPISNTDIHHCKCDNQKGTLIEHGKDEDANPDFSDVTNGSENHDKISDSDGNHLHCRDRTLALNILYLLFKALDDSLSDDITPEHTLERPPVTESEKEVEKDEPTTERRIALGTNPDPHDGCYWDFSLENGPEIANDDGDEFDMTETSDPVAHTHEHTMQNQLHHVHNTHHSSHTTLPSKPNNQRKYLQNTEEGYSVDNSPESPRRTYNGKPTKGTHNRESIINTQSVKHGSQTSITKGNLLIKDSNESEDRSCGRSFKARVTSGGNTENKGQSQSPKISPTSGLSATSSRCRNTEERGKFTSDRPPYSTIDDASWMNSHHYDSPSDYSEEDWQAFIWQKQLESSEEKQTSESFTLPETTPDNSALKLKCEKLRHEGSRERTGNQHGNQPTESEGIVEENLFDKFSKLLIENERLRTQFNRPSNDNRGARKNVKEKTSNKSAADTTENIEKILIYNEGKTQKRKYSDVFLTGTRRHTNVESENNSRKTYKKESSGDEAITATPFVSECEREEKSFCCPVEESTFWDDSKGETSKEKHMHERDEFSGNYEGEHEDNTQEPISKEAIVEFGVVSSEEDASYWDFNFEESLEETPNNTPNNNMEPTIYDEEGDDNRPSVCECTKPIVPLVAPIQRSQTPKRAPICTTKQATRNNRNNVEPEKSSDIDDDEKYTGPSVCICSKPTLPLVAPAKPCTRHSGRIPTVTTQPQMSRTQRYETEQTESNDIDNEEYLGPSVCICSKPSIPLVAPDKPCNSDIPGRIPTVTTQPQTSRTQRYETEQTESDDIDNEEYLGPSVCICSKPTIPLVAPDKPCNRDLPGRIPAVTMQPQTSKTQRYETEQTESDDIDNEEYLGPSVCICSKPTIPLIAPTKTCDRNFSGRVPTVTAQPQMTKRRRCEIEQTETYDSDDEEYTRPSARISSKPTLPLKASLKKCDRDFPGRLPTVTSQPKMAKNQMREFQQTETYDTDDKEKSSDVEDDEKYRGPSVCICSKPTLPLVAPSRECDRDFPGRVPTVTTQSRMAKRQRHEAEETEAYDTDDEKYTGPSVCICSKPTLPLIAPAQKCKCEVPQNRRDDTHERKTTHDSEEKYSAPSGSLSNKQKLTLYAPTANWDCHSRRLQQLEATKDAIPESNVAKFFGRPTKANNVRSSPQQNSDRFSDENRSCMETRIYDEAKNCHNKETDIDVDNTRNIQTERLSMHQPKKSTDSKISRTISDQVYQIESHENKRRTGRTRGDSISGNAETRRQLGDTIDKASSENSERIDGNIYSDFWDFEKPGIEGGSQEYNDNFGYSRSETSQKRNNVVISKAPPLFVSSSDTRSQSAMTSSTKSTKQLDSSRKRHSRPYAATENNDVEKINTRRDNVKTSHSSYNGNKKRNSEGDLNVKRGEYKQRSFEVPDNSEKGGRKPVSVPSYTTPLTSTSTADLRRISLNQEPQPQRIDKDRPQNEYTEQRSSRPNTKERTNEHYSDADEILPEVDNAAASPSQASPPKYSNGHHFRGYLRSIPTNLGQESKTKRIEVNTYTKEYPQQPSSRPNRKERINEYYSDADEILPEIDNAAASPSQASPPKYSNGHTFRGYLRSIPTNLSQESKTKRMEVNTPKEEYPQQRSSRPNRKEHTKEYCTDAHGIDNAAASVSQESPSKYSNNNYFRGYLRSIPTTRVELLQEQEKNRHRKPFSESTRGPNVHDVDGNSNRQKTQPQERQRYRGQTYSYTRQTGHSQASAGPADRRRTPIGPGNSMTGRENANFPSNLKSSSASVIPSSETSDSINPGDHEWFPSRRPWSHRMYEESAT